MVTLNQGWQALIDKLNAETVYLQVDAGNIDAGIPGEQVAELPAAPPFVRVYAKPDGLLKKSDGGAVGLLAGVGILCGAAPAASGFESAKAALELAERVEKTALEIRYIQRTATPIEPLVVTSDLTIYVIEFIFQYKSSA